MPTVKIGILASRAAAIAAEGSMPAFCPPSLNTTTPATGVARSSLINCRSDWPSRVSVPCGEQSRLPIECRLGCAVAAGRVLRLRSVCSAAGGCIGCRERRAWRTTPMRARSASKRHSTDVVLLAQLVDQLAIVEQRRPPARAGWAWPARPRPSASCRPMLRLVSTSTSTRELCTTLRSVRFSRCR